MNGPTGKAKANINQAGGVTISGVGGAGKKGTTSRTAPPSPKRPAPVGQPHLTGPRNRLSNESLKQKIYSKLLGEDVPATSVASGQISGVAPPDPNVAYAANLMKKHVKRRVARRRMVESINEGRKPIHPHEKIARKLDHASKHLTKYAHRWGQYPSKRMEMHAHFYDHTRATNPEAWDYYLKKHGYIDHNAGDVMA